MVLFYGQKNANIDVFRELPNKLHPSLKLTEKKKKTVVNKTLILLHKF